MTVHCDQARLLLDLTRGPQRWPETDPAWEHVARCRSCQGFVEANRAIGRRLAAWATRTHAPAHLRARVLASLRSAALRGRRRRLLALGGGTGLIAAGLVVFALLRSPTIHVAEPLAEHARVGLANAANTITSSDGATVHEWLDRHIGYPVELPDIAGAVLTGARVIEWLGEPSAAIVYHYRGMPLTYFALPPGEPAGARLASRVIAVSTDGYAVALWTEQGGPRALAAPMEGREVRAIAEECRRKATPRS